MPSPSASPEEIAAIVADEAVGPRTGVTLHLVDDEGVLLDTASQKLYRLNTTAAFIWCCIEDRLSRAESVARLGRAFGTTGRDAESYVAAAVDGWSALGLLAGNGAPLADALSSPEPKDGAPAAIAAPFIPVIEKYYRLLDTDFRLRFASSATAADMHRFLAPLAERRPDERDLVTIDVRESGARRALYHGDRIIERWAAPDELVPVAKIALVTFALERSQDFGALHAGAVSRRGDGPCVVIAGVSGAGKSTLVAGLATSGFTSLGDDTIVLARDPLAVRAIPFGICLKDGAWDLLSGRIPGLSEQPVHQRLDGKRVRYFVPHGMPAPLGRAVRNPAVAVVFPNRTTGGSGHLVRISHADALTRIASEFCPLGGQLDVDKVERLIQWVGSMKCYELRYSTLDQGIKAIGELCP